MSDASDVRAAALPDPLARDCIHPAHPDSMARDYIHPDSAGRPDRASKAVPDAPDPYKSDVPAADS